MNVNITNQKNYYSVLSSSLRWSLGDSNMVEDLIQWFSVSEKYISTFVTLLSSSLLNRPSTINDHSRGDGIPTRGQRFAVIAFTVSFPREAIIILLLGIDCDH